MEHVQKTGQFDAPTSIYVVQLNLKCDSFTSNQKQYKRTRQCLLENLEKFTLILSWHPSKQTICPSSIAKYFYDQGCNVRVGRQRFVTRSKSVYVPNIPVASNEQNENNNLELMEWLGMFSLDTDLEVDTSNYLNTYECPSDCKWMEYVQYLEWNGLFTIQQVQLLYDALTKFIMSANKIPWVSMCVQGFSDSPVAWKMEEHHYYTNGDNLYALFLQPNGKYLLCTQSCSNKKHK